MFERAGYAEEIARVREARARRDRDGAVAAISERMCDDIDLVGSADEVRDHVRRYADSGVDDVIVLPLPWGANRRAVIDDTLEALTPLVRGDGMPG